MRFRRSKSMRLSLLLLFIASRSEDRAQNPVNKRSECVTIEQESLSLLLSFC